MPNGYYGAGAKLSHPCYILGKGYECPCCGKIFKTEAPLEWHYLREHNPTESEAKEIVRWQRFGKHFNTPEHQERERKKKERRAVKKKMLALGYKLPSRLVRSILDYAFIAPNGEGVSYEKAKEIVFNQ
jgi:hypothetical protein